MMYRLILFCFCFIFSQSFRSHMPKIKLTQLSDILDKRWSNSNYSKEVLNDWFCKLDKSLLTVGAKGVTVGHVNSLSDLLAYHERVRVKIATDKMDINKISQELLSHEKLFNKTVLLEIRNREFMVGRL